MKIPKRGEKGFTLVELLIVLAILAVLAAVVIPSVTGMFGRGAEQAYRTDERTIQSGVMAYVMDVRDAGVVADAGHYFPICIGAAEGVYPFDGDDEPGPYLAEQPESSGALNGNVDDPGTYLWILDEGGQVYGIYQIVAGEDWYAGCYGSYP
ncbi:hypothetical protein ES703_86277 [subsurface metagenome]